MRDLSNSVKYFNIDFSKGGATIESCSAAAKASGYAYFGLQGANGCWGGNTFGNYATATIKIISATYGDAK